MATTATTGPMATESELETMPQKEVRQTDLESGTDTATLKEEQDDRDPDVVDWDGPNDPANPMNWPDSKKWFNIAILSILTLITYVSPKSIARKRCLTFFLVLW
jgi:hypothetical protein